MNKDESLGCEGPADVRMVKPRYAPNKPVLTYDGQGGQGEAVVGDIGRAFYEASNKAWGISASWEFLTQQERDRQRSAAKEFLALHAAQPTPVPAGDWFCGNCRTPVPAPKPAVPMPTTEDEAAAMQMLGQAWLEQNAPHRLKPAPVPAEFDVRKILLNIVPGDGDGEEVFAKNVEDVVRAMTEMSEKLQAAEEWVDRHKPAQPTQEMITAAQSAYWPGVQVPSVHCITRALKAALSAAPKPEHGGAS